MRSKAAPSISKVTTETEGKAKLIKKIFSPVKVDVKPKDVSPPKVEDEIDLRYFRDAHNSSVTERKLFSEMETKELTVKKKKKPWKCRFCRKRFLSKINLKIHSRKRHPFKSLDEEEEKEKKDNVILLDTRRRDEKAINVSFQESDVIFDDVDHDDEETDPYEDDSVPPVGLTPEMEKKPESQKDIDDGKRREADDRDEKEVALQKARALEILTSRALEDRAKKKQLKKILKSKAKKEKTRKEISLNLGAEQIETRELPKMETRINISDAISNALKELPRDPRQGLVPDLNNISNGKEAQTNTDQGEREADLTSDNKRMSFHDDVENIEVPAQLGKNPEYENKTAKEKLSARFSRILAAEPEDQAVEEAEKGDQLLVEGLLKIEAAKEGQLVESFEEAEKGGQLEGLPKISAEEARRVSSCLFLEGWTVDGETKEATNPTETRAGVDQVKSVESVGVSFAKDEEEEPDLMSDALKEKSDIKSTSLIEIRQEVEESDLTLAAPKENEIRPEDQRAKEQKPEFSTEIDVASDKER